MTEQWQTGLEPALVWQHFATLCRIPRASGNEAALRDTLQSWAESRGWACVVDEAGNLVIRKPASPGREQEVGVVLQGHLDMVCQKNAGSQHDFSRDPICPVVQDGWLKAEETTLGADNGIGVALALAALEDQSLSHPPLEVLLTVVEESGMDGARGLKPGLLHGRKLINLDTEEWGEIYLGCAGGLDVNVSRPGAAAALPAGYSVHTLALTGLRGGHSGVNIHEERGNAIKLLVRVLRAVESSLSLRLVELTGGTARNALPREAFATIAVPSELVPTLDGHLAQWQALFRAELAEVEPVDKLLLQRAEAPQPVEQVLSAAEQRIWLASLHAAPHGVKRKSLSVPGVVETSNNLGMVHINAQGGQCNFMLRSLRDSGSEALAQEIISLFSLSGSHCEASGHYAGWTPNPASPLLAQCMAVYSATFGGIAKQQVIHAGLECGLIGAQYPDMDMVSFGPTIHGAHAPGEMVDITSVAHTWQLLKAVLAAV